MSTEKSPLANYRIYDRTGGGVTEDIYAETLEEAIEAGREWIEDGDWSGCGDHDDGDVIARVRTIELECEVGEIVYRPEEPALGSIITNRWDLWSPEWDTESSAWRIDVSDIYADEGEDKDGNDERVRVAEALSAATGGEWTYEPVGERVIWTPPEDAEMEEDEEATRAADTHDCSGTYSDDEPDCPVEEQGWDFRSTTEMGDDFGCRSHGGTAMTHYGVCRNTGIYRDTHTPGCQRNPNEPLEIVTYRERDEASEKWIKEQHEEDGWLPDWLAEYLGCPPTTRMTEEQAKEWVADHSDEDDLDEDDLEHAFAAIFGRRADDRDRTEGLWSHLNESHSNEETIH